jgi:hypothetical protein
VLEQETEQLPAGVPGGADDRDPHAPARTSDGRAT